MILKFSGCQSIINHRGSCYFATTPVVSSSSWKDIYFLDESYFDPNGFVEIPSSDISYVDIETLWGKVDDE